MPFHIRPLLRVNKSKNPKGIALFARAYFFLYQKTSDPAFLRKGESLTHWLLENPSPGYNQNCWGYNFIWQNTIFLQDAFEPNAVVTVFVGETLMHAYRITENEKYLLAACSVADFILKDLPVLYDENDELAIAYVLRKVDAIVLNNQVLIGAFLVKIWKHIKENHLMNIASRLINFTVNRATEYYAWYYTYPKEKSPISHDNYHTGGILDGLIEYFEETGDDRYMQIYWNGLEYYQKKLFEPNGAPRWMNDKKFPFDIHGSAQGIITFKKASRYDSRYQDQADIILDWTVNNLYRKKRHDFIYRQGRWFRWNYSLMRWCNAWMARALAELISVS
jgi:rhamnogalacturonyl hydrolase YesR